MNKIKHVGSFIAFLFKTTWRVLRDKRTWFVVAFIVWTWLISFFNANYYTQSPVKEWQPVIMPRYKVAKKIVKNDATMTKKPIVEEKTTTDVISEQFDLSDKEIANYIKSKDWDYSIAIRLAKSENFWNLTKSFNCSRIHTNTNGSVDVGIFQINSIHTKTLAKMGMTMEDMKDCKKNIDFAYSWIYKNSGWGAWSAYNNGSYLNHSEI